MDFEQVQWLNFTIRARDHGTPPRIAELPVYLRIVDVNDNNPVFLQPSYQVRSTMFSDKCFPPNKKGSMLLKLRTSASQKIRILCFSVSYLRK